MKRSGSLRRHTPLRASTRPRGRRQAPNTRPAPLRPCVCALCGQVALCHGHHRLRRSQGGTDAHLVQLCQQCHLQRVHGNPRWAYAHRWLLHAWSVDGPPIAHDLDCPIDHTAEAT